MARKNKQFYSFIIFLFILSGCNLAPEYQVPCTDTPDQWKREQVDEGSTPEIENWWEIFEDDLLDCLEEELLQNNKELEKAFYKVFEARASAGEQQSKLYPDLSVYPLYSSTGFLTRIFGLPSSLPSISRIHELIYAFPLNLYYEVDLWGKLRNNYRSAVMDAQSKEYAYRACYLMLTAELASDYFQLRAIDTQLKILSGIIQARQDFLAVVKERYRTGWVNGIDQTRAETLLSQAETALLEAARERALLENSIAVLIGSPASIFHLDPNPIVSKPPAIPAGIPSQILLQRPDIKEAERLTAAANAQIGASRASFFPSLQLTGFCGYESPDLKDFFKWNSRFWSADGLVKETIFDGGKHESQLDYSWTRFSQASAEYQQRVLISFKEVEDALANLQYYNEEMEKLEKAEQSAIATSQITLSLYKNGQINYQDVADSERETLQQRQKTIENLAKRYLSTIQLIKALGGSWCDN